MSISNISLANLYQGELNAINFSLLGMLFVFGGLVIIALYIVLLPKLLEILKKKPKRQASTTIDTNTEKESEIMLAIAAAFHLNQNFPEVSERITWKSHGDMESPWLVSGRVHGLSVRNDIQSWRKS